MLLEADCRPGHGPESGELGPATGDDQRQPQPRTGFDCEVDALVSDQSTETEVVRSPSDRRFALERREPINVARRVNHDGVALVAVGDALRNARRDGDELVDGTGRPPIPSAQLRTQGATDDCGWAV